MHDEHLFKCRLPLFNLQLELTDGQKSQNVHLELDENELTRLIDQMTEIEQVKRFLLKIFSSNSLFLGNEQQFSMIPV